MSETMLDVDAVLAEPLVPAREAGRAIGYVGPDIPEDLLAVPGYAALHLPWRRPAKTPWADVWLEDAFPGWARTILEDWAAGRFDFLEAVIFSRGDDAAQRLYYYVCELQRQQQIGGPTPLVFDVARIPRASSVEWTARAVGLLAAELGLSDTDLVAGIAVANKRRESLRELDSDAALPGRYRERIARASLFVGTERLALDRVPRLADRTHFRGMVLLAGSAPPDDGLHLAVEAAGWTVAADVHPRNLARLGPPIEDGDEPPARRIARHVHEHSPGPRGFRDRGAAIVRVARELGVDAVVLWLFEEDEAFAWDVVGARRQLEQAGIPSLILARRRWDLSDAPGEDIARFLAELKP
ncbi:MAG TPA: 2-hydroxyacyl-CoA dehydratase family protein [Woeseiaceae bacterium]|nr:2-hydroxyacyl-CoA dehydratase family protein [Woeseiaceae bacterium]